MINCYKDGLIIQPFMVVNLLYYDVHVGNNRNVNLPCMQDTFARATHSA